MIIEINSKSTQNHIMTEVTYTYTKAVTLFCYDDISGTISISNSCPIDINILLDKTSVNYLYNYAIS